MLTFKKDIYEKILNPSGIMYSLSQNKKDKPYVVVKNIEPVWEMLYPDTIKSLMSLASFSAINNGKSDQKNGTDKRRYDLKMHLKGQESLLYVDLEEHLDELVYENAGIELYNQISNTKMPYHDLYKVELESFCNQNAARVYEKKKEILSRVAGLIKICLPMICEDQRIPQELIRYISDASEDNVLKVIEVLCIFAIFAYDDDDVAFFSEVKNHFCNPQKKTEGPDTEIKKLQNGALPHELTDTVVVNATAESVLFRETEFKQITEALKDKNTKSILLSGMGGCGKTSIARYVYCALKNQYDCCGWINFNDSLKRSMISSIKMGEYNDETMTEGDAQKKWQYIMKAFSDSKQSKLLVIDNVDYIEGVQNPILDRELSGISSWDNVKVIVTTRLPQIDGINTVYHIQNLGDKEADAKCVELFYHYNPEAKRYRNQNEDTVKKICKLADYNTMVIELLAKGSVYESEKLELFYSKLLSIGFQYADDVPVRTNHDYNELHFVDDDGKLEKSYYNVGRETAASQLMKLFNIKTRTETERQILWDFHCLPEAERITGSELKSWLGYSIMEINSLREEGWIKYQDSEFFIHPLVRQAIVCHDNEWQDYWEYGKRRRNEKGIQDDFISKLLHHCLYEKDDSFEERIRKLVFADCLTMGGKMLDVKTLLYIADHARRSGVRDCGVKYYRKTYEEMHNLENSDFVDDMDILWKGTYFYGYMLSYTKAGYDKAEKLVRESLEIAKKSANMLGNYSENDIEKLSAKQRALLASSYDQLGYILSNEDEKNIRKLSEADTCLKTAVELRRSLYESNPNSINPLHDYAWSLDNLGSLYANIDISKIDFTLTDSGGDVKYFTSDYIESEKKRSEEYLKEALDIRRILSDLRGDSDSTEVAWTCCNLAILLSKDKCKEAQVRRLLDEALGIYGRLEQRFPGQHVGSEARTCIAYARFLKESTGYTDEALSYFQRALTLNQSLEKDYPGVYKEEIENVESEIKDFYMHLHK